MYNGSHQDEYEELPECIKHTYSEKEYAYLPQELKRTLIDDECLPDVEED